MKTVLFVDDEQSIRNSIERMYLERDDVRLLFAASGQAGLEILEREEVWVVVSDYLMPEMRGIEFLSRARTLRPETVRIMMTAYAELSIAIEAINKSEAYRFITKPWNNRELESIVDEALLRYELVQSLKSADEAVCLSLAQTVELKDPYTKGHCDRVASYAVSLARAAGMDERVIGDIRHGSWLHDCGKIGVPERVLNHTGKLSVHDFKTVMQHPRWGSEVARQARMSDTVINIILYHHERYNGEGYPFGLKGGHIPIEARIVTIADVFDALYSDRPYRKAYDFDQTIGIMHEMTETHFDPQLMKLFLPIAGQARNNPPAQSVPVQAVEDGTAHDRI
jgi:response regulator RpfG family c-di-GMP phosphodiesterase